MENKEKQRSSTDCMYRTNPFIHREIPSIQCFEINCIYTVLRKAYKQTKEEHTLKTKVMKYKVHSTEY